MVKAYKLRRRTETGVKRKDPYKKYFLTIYICCTHILVKVQLRGSSLC